MGRHKITPSIGRLIIKSIRSDEKFSKWMKEHVKPKEYYFFKKKYGSSFSYKTVSTDAFEQIKILGLNYTKSDAEYFVRTFGSFAACVIFYRAGVIQDQKTKQRNYYLSVIEKTLVNSRLHLANEFSVDRLIDPYEVGVNKHLFVAPVCPDYSHTNTKDGGYRYNFRNK